MSRKKLLAFGFLLGAPLAIPALAQQAGNPSDLDVTLTVVEDAESVEDVLNSIELPPDIREAAEETLAAVMAAVSAAQRGDVKSKEDAEALVREAVARSSELAANARLSADAASEDAQRAAEVAREAVEEAVKNALSGADMQGVIEQMMQDILNSLPDDIRNQLTLDLDSLIDQAKQGLPPAPGEG
ncbi:hypothetical protein SAMN04487965_2645 [Microbulbifer donghaiensis]|uniref:DUF2059 domain-containing protein n=1 Tax=Microbulbifer donghaiensis TaxID=494016 RepID=A0A1M5EB88_9GAMM|nr:hypothetical protein [Microbulbifer donghaiensis]SHF76499.1 hypothetical protein SAMN04487965_2645 [Microbulbifer donghaiensis]